MFFSKPKNYNISMGRSIKEITKLEDGVFSKKTIGDGFFFDSNEKTLVIKAFEKCKVTMLFPTKHAMGLKMDRIDVMFHYGLDTFAENGAGIECNLKEGQMVNKGDVLLTIDNEYYKKNGYQTPVIYAFTNIDEMNYDMHITDGEAGELVLEKRV